MVLSLRFNMIHFSTCVKNKLEHTPKKPCCANEIINKIHGQICTHSPPILTLWSEIGLDLRLGFRGLGSGRVKDSVMVRMVDRNK